MIAFSGIMCSGHKIACKKLNNTFVTVNNNFLVTREVICQRFSLVTSSLVKIIGKSPHSWPKIVIHGNSCIILYVIKQALGWAFCPSSSDSSNLGSLLLITWLIIQNDWQHLPECRPLTSVLDGYNLLKNLEENHQSCMFSLLWNITLFFCSIIS